MKGKSLNPLKRVNSILTAKLSNIINAELESQSPQAGQFNSYAEISERPRKHSRNRVSIPSSGSIQFLLDGKVYFNNGKWELSQSPQAGQFNSYILFLYSTEMLNQSQSPQAGQFNSYNIYINVLPNKLFEKSQSPQAGQFNSYCFRDMKLKIFISLESQSPQAGQFNSYRIVISIGLAGAVLVSIPSSGSIQFLRRHRVYVFSHKV